MVVSYGDSILNSKDGLGSCRRRAARSDRSATLPASRPITPCKIGRLRDQQSGQGVTANFWASQPGPLRLPNMPSLTS